MRKRNIFLTIFIVIAVWLYYAYLIKKISILEKSNLKLEKEITELEKEKNKKIYEYDKIVDLKKIEEEMTKNKKMIPSEKIIFFKIDDDSF